MKFGEKLRRLREQRGMTQDDVAKAIGITRRSYIHYETGNRYPRTRDKYEALAKLFDVETDYLYMENEIFVGETREKYGSCGKHQANALVNELAGLFAGGDLSDEDKTEIMRSLERAFWMAKEENTKHISK